MTATPDWRRGRPPGVRPLAPMGNVALHRRKQWRALVERARIFAFNPEVPGGLAELVHQAVVVRAGKLRGPDPAFEGLGMVGETLASCLAAVCLALKDASPPMLALSIPVLRELAEGVDGALVEAQTRAAQGWRAQMGD